MERAMEVMQVIEKHAEHTPDPEVKLLDCSQVPEVIALGNLSDAQLIDLLRSDPGNALYLIAFYHLHAGLVRSLLASEGKSENLNRWIWFSAFRTLTDSQKKVIPVAGWLGRIVALSLIHREEPPVMGALPIPLAWYLHQSLEMMPIPLRITAVMSEITKSTDNEISQFFHLRQMPLSVIEVEQLRNESHRFFVDRIPVDVRRLYFGDPLDVESPIRLLSSLGINVQAEIQSFERWHGVQDDGATPPIATASRKNDIKPNGKSSKNSLGSLFLGLMLIGGGVAALFALVTAPQQPTLSPTSSAISIPATSVPSVQKAITSTTETVSATTTIPGAQPNSSTPGTAATSSPKPDLAATDKTVAPSAKSLPVAEAPSKTPTASTVIPKTNSVANDATGSSTKPTVTNAIPSAKPVATTVVPSAKPAPKPVPKVAVLPSTKPPVPAPKPVIALNGQLPLLDDAPRNRPPRFFAVLVADPQKKNLLSAKRFEPGSYYRSLQGQSWIQVGAYDTLAKATAAMQEFKAKGFSVTIART
ncbi:MAG: hypothetical protein H7Y37_04475 [Anaerolineae bacterium]|nr:hypothetical protein [Gloeobacterales cyanobacterium ES-bin-313]